ncbi:MAG: ArsB/NhaD family transporter [Actinomycetes bacterium]
MNVAVAVVAFLVVYVLLISERVERVVAAGIGAALVLGLGVVGTQDVFFSEKTGIDWNVIVLLFSMMVIVGGLRRTGVFDYVAITLAQRAQGRTFVLLLLLTSMTAVSAMFLSDVAVVVLLAPVILLVADRLSLPPVPLLVAVVMAANIGGSASLIGDPADIIVGTRAGLTFTDFVTHQLPMSLVAFLVFLAVAWVMFRRHLVAAPGSVQALSRLDARQAIKDHALLRRGLAVLALVVLGFLAQPVTGTEPALVALLGAGLMWVVTREDRHALLDHVEWETLAFLMGLFVVVGALVKVGAIDRLTELVSGAVGSDPTTAVLGMLVGSAGVSALVDNIPYVATMSPVVANLSAADPGLSPDGALWYALAMGAVLGGNATAIGASANVVVIGIARRNGHPISFWTFTRYGVVVAVATVAAVLPLFYLRYLR